MNHFLNEIKNINDNSIKSQNGINEVDGQIKL